MAVRGELDPVQPFHPHRPPEIDQCVDRFLAAMCNSSRRYILELLGSPHEEAGRLMEKRSGEIAQRIGLSNATTSEHLSLLASLGLVSARREGNSVYYQIDGPLVARAFHDLLTALERHCASFHPHPGSEEVGEPLQGEERS